jgi:SAM-dependent methyltransferase
MQSQPAENPQDIVNRRVYHRPDVHRWYPPNAGLDQAETMALLAYQPAFAGRAVLDIGVGTGRTARYLAPLAAAYVATDYSPDMIAYLREHMPALDTRNVDMRDLSVFADGTFDFALASANVIDAVSHADRLRTLAELHRVLRAEGILMFSSHNRRFRLALRGPWLERARNPVTQAVHIARLMRGIVNHARVGRLRRIEADYALLNDHGHDYAALHYYIDREHQHRQLEAAGFTLCDVFDSSGRRLNADDDDSADPSLLYVARRRP